MAHWGPACVSVEAVELVTADGQLIKASAAEHPELFWGRARLRAGDVRRGDTLSPEMLSTAASHRRQQLLLFAQRSERSRRPSGCPRDEKRLIWSSCRFSSSSPGRTRRGVPRSQWQVVPRFGRGVRNDQARIAIGPGAPERNRRAKRRRWPAASISRRASTNWRSLLEKRGRRIIATSSKTSARRPIPPTS